MYAEYYLCVLQLTANLSGNTFLMKNTRYIVYKIE